MNLSITGRSVAVIEECSTVHRGGLCGTNARERPKRKMIEAAVL